MGIERTTTLRMLVTIRLLQSVPTSKITETLSPPVVASAGTCPPSGPPRARQPDFVQIKVQQCGRVGLQQIDLHFLFHKGRHRRICILDPQSGQQRLALAHTDLTSVSELLSI